MVWWCTWTRRKSSSIKTLKILSHKFIPNMSISTSILWACEWLEDKFRAEILCSMIHLFFYGKLSLRTPSLLIISFLLIFSYLFNKNLFPVKKLLCIRSILYRNSKIDITLICLLRFHSFVLMGLMLMLRLGNLWMKSTPLYAMSPNSLLKCLGDRLWKTDSLPNPTPLLYLILSVSLWSAPSSILNP